MMKIAIIDDNINDQNIIEAKLKEYFKENNLHIRHNRGGGMFGPHGDEPVQRSGQRAYPQRRRCREGGNERGLFHNVQQDRFRHRQRSPMFRKHGGDTGRRPDGGRHDSDCRGCRMVLERLQLRHEGQIHKPHTAVLFHMEIFL